jgi:Holliday junction resolvase RusA-like endonuclease
VAHLALRRLRSTLAVLAARLPALPGALDGVAPGPPMIREVAFRVDGTPAPKGSMRAFTVPLRNGGVGARVIPDNRPQARSWSADVADAARSAMAQAPMFAGVALMVRIVFRLVRPAGHFGKTGLKRSAPVFPSVKPDLDKLLRATMDPLEGVVYDGDSRIVAFDARKVYTAPGEVAGADITVQQLVAERWVDEQPVLALADIGGTEGART